MRGGQLVRSDHTVTLGVRLDADDAARVQREARRRGVSVSFLLGELARDLVNRSEDR